jgi:hypothetical protein
MSDIQRALEKLRGEVAECLVLSNLATDPQRRELFARVAEHITGLVSAAQNELAVEPANVVQAADLKKVDALDPPVPPRQRTTSHRIAWVSAVALAAAAGIATAGAYVLASAEKGSFTALEANIVSPPTPQEDTKQAIAELKQAIAEFRSAEEDKRELLSQELAALAARVAKFEKARAESVEPAIGRPPETILVPTIKRDLETLRQPVHRRTASSNSRRLRPGWGLFAPLRF